MRTNPSAFLSVYSPSFHLAGSSTRRTRATRSPPGRRSHCACAARRVATGLGRLQSTCGLGRCPRRLRGRRASSRRRVRPRGGARGCPTGITSSVRASTGPAELRWVLIFTLCSGPSFCDTTARAHPSTLPQFTSRPIHSLIHSTGHHVTASTYRHLTPHVHTSTPRCTHTLHLSHTRHA